MKVKNTMKHIKEEEEEVGTIPKIEAEGTSKANPQLSKIKEPQEFKQEIIQNASTIPQNLFQDLASFVSKGDVIPRKKPNNNKNKLKKQPSISSIILAQQSVNDTLDAFSSRGDMASRRAMSTASGTGGVGSEEGGEIVVGVVTDRMKTASSVGGARLTSALISNYYESHENDNKHHDKQFQPPPNTHLLQQEAPLIGESATNIVTRREVELLKQSLLQASEKMKKSFSSRKKDFQTLLDVINDEQNLYDLVFEELIRQVSSHMAERGDILRALREKYMYMFKRIPITVKFMHTELLTQKELNRRMREELIRVKNKMEGMMEDLAFLAEDHSDSESEYEDDQQNKDTNHSKKNSIVGAQSIPPLSSDKDQHHQDTNTNLQSQTTHVVSESGTAHHPAKHIQSSSSQHRKNHSHSNHGQQQQQHHHHGAPHPDLDKNIALGKYLDLYASRLERLEKSLRNSEEERFFWMEGVKFLINKTAQEQQNQLLMDFHRSEQTRYLCINARISEISDVTVKHLAIAEEKFKKLTDNQNELAEMLSYRDNKSIRTLKELKDSIHGFYKIVSERFSAPEKSTKEVKNVAAYDIRMLCAKATQWLVDISEIASHYTSDRQVKAMNLYEAGQKDCEDVFAELRSVLKIYLATNGNRDFVRVSDFLETIVHRMEIHLATTRVRILGENDVIESVIWLQNQVEDSLVKQFVDVKKGEYFLKWIQTMEDIEINLNFGLNSEQEELLVQMNDYISHLRNQTDNFLISLRDNNNHLHKTVVAWVLSFISPNEFHKKTEDTKITIQKTINFQEALKVIPVSYSKQAETVLGPLDSWADQFEKLSLSKDGKRRSG